ncbi:MAG: HRDC domain-containing protein [Chloroflexota bacterium]|nr:HRDC domain-containing protein [Chloroflexota bacterium]MDE2948647.1 HRDC domain-containing protein [Chloroflexota bacterium]
MALSPPMLPPAVTIDDPRALAAAVQRLRGADRIAIDTESNSLHAYRGRTCLIQLSTPAEDLLIDPLAIADISALAPVLADPAIEKTFHAAEYDLICLKRDFDFDVRNIFDTMAAARVCGIQRIGLGNMLEDLLGVRHSKKHQKYDWARRPLPESVRRYAQVDTHYLLPLRAALIERLQSLDRLEEAREYIADVTRFEPQSEEFDPNGFWRLAPPKALNRPEIAVLRELYILRDELAKSVDHPPPRLIPNKALLQIVKMQPRSAEYLYDIRGLPAWLVRQSGDEIVEAVKHGRASRLPVKRPRPKPVPAPVAERYTALHNWRKATANARGVESDVIISRRALWDIARRKPASVAELSDICGLGPWRRATYGAELVAIVRGGGQQR